MSDIKTPPTLLKYLNRSQGHLSFPIVSSKIVKNVPGSSEYKEPNDNSCIGYWEQETGFVIDGRRSYVCPSCGKLFRGCQYEGAHVTVAGLPASLWFFVPLCPECNHPTNTDWMNVDAPLVPVPVECYEKKPKEK